MLPPYLSLLRLAWRQYLYRFDLVLYGHLFFTLPLVVIGTYYKQWFPIAETAQTLTDLWPNFFIQVGVDNAASILGGIVSVVIVMGMRRALQKQPTNFIVVLREAWPFYLPMILLALIELVLTVSGLGLFIIPGIVIAVLFTFTTSALAWHRLSVVQAIQHSIQLVRGQFFWVLLYVFQTQLLMGLAILVMTWNLPHTFYFDIFGAWMSMVCTSFLLVFITVMMNARETLMATTPATSSRPPSV